MSNPNEQSLQNMRTFHPDSINTTTNNNIGHLYCAATIIIYSTAHYNSSHKTLIIIIT